MAEFPEFLSRMLHAMWESFQELGLWLLAGFVLAGFVGQLLPLSFIKKHLAGNKASSVFKAVLIGVPLPLCSCGVIPVAASLRKAGASRGAVAAFTAATPQTGVESIAASWSMMGLPFSIARVLADVVAGLFSGTLINALERKAGVLEAPAPLPSCQSCEAQGEEKNSWKQKTRLALREGLIDLPAEIGKYVLIGVFVGAVLTALFPHEALAQFLENRWVSYFAVTLLALPLFVCATGSIPIAASLVAIGFSPGAALIFLVLGPATNPSTIAVLWRILGRSASLVYLLCLTVTAWAFAFGFDALEYALGVTHTAQDHGHSEAFGTLFAVLLLAVFLISYLVRRREGCRCHIHAGHSHHS